MSVQTATNPETKEQVVLVDGTWLPVSQTATNPDTGARAYLANGSWVVDETAPTPAVEPEIEPERTVLGQAGEFVKAIPRGFGRTILGSLEGAAELADAATNTIGLENLIDSGEENALVSAARQGQKSLNDSFLGVDKAYEDAWITKFGEGLGSLATFATPATVLKLANVTSKIGKAVPYALAGTSGAGEQAQRIDQRREEGMDVSSGQEDAAVLLGGIVGLSEMVPISRFLRGYDTKITDDIAAPIMKRLSEAAVSGIGEGVQETIAGLAQEGIERGIYNPDADFGQGSLDNFTVGAAAGFTADLILNSMAKGRQRSFTEAETAKENENRKVEEERRVRVRKTYDPSSLGPTEVDADGNPVVLELEPEIDLATIPPRNDSMVSYGREIAVSLGQDFPTETSFSIEQVSLPLTEAEIANQPESVDAEGNPLGVPQATSQPAFQVYDADGRAYGSPRIGYEEAALLAGTLDREVLDQSVRNSVDSIIDNTAEEYDENVVDAVDDVGNPLGQAMSIRETLQAIGNSILNPRANQITSNAVNMAAGTTQDRGFDETLSAEEVMNKNMGRVFTEADMVSSLTASQRINRQRIAKGLPETQVFTVKEAKSVLGKNFGRLGDIGAGGLVETQQYYAGKDKAGKPVVFSSAGEIITKRYLTKKDGTDYAKPRTITTDKDAEIAAATLNRRYNKTVDETTFKSMEMGEKQIKTLLERKGINDSLNSPAINSMARAYVGKPSVSKMNRGEKKFFYQKLRKLPALSQPLTEGLPNFSEAALKQQNRVQQEIIEEEVLALPPPDINLPSSELIDEMESRLAEELNRLGIANNGVTGRIFQQYRKYGLTPDGEVVTRGGVDANLEAGYVSDFNEIAFGIQQIFADTDINMSDSNAVWEKIKSILNHETVHALRTLDLFTAEEYQVLEKAAATQKVKGSKLTYLEQAVQLYPEFVQGNSKDRTKLMEEAVAELVRDNTTLGGRPRTIINKIKGFLESVSLWIVGSPTNVRRVVEDIQSGKIGGREAGQIRSLRSTRRNAQVFESESLPVERKKEGLGKGQRLPDTSSKMSQIINEVDEAEVSYSKVGLNQQVSNVVKGVVPLINKNRKGKKLNQGQVTKKVMEFYRSLPEQKSPGKPNPKGTFENAFKTLDRAKLASREDLSYQDVTIKIPEIAVATILYKDGLITKAQRDRVVDNFKPVTPYKSLPDELLTKENDAVNALDANKKERFKKSREAISKEALEYVSLRLDIPAYLKDGSWIVAVHRPKAAQIKDEREPFTGLAQGSIGYELAFGINNVSFGTAPESKWDKLGRGVATSGGTKSTFAVINGRPEVEATDESLISEARSILKDMQEGKPTEWTQVGYDPERHAYYYDRVTGDPVGTAERVIQVGPLVLAKNINTNSRGESIKVPKQEISYSRRKPEKSGITKTDFDSDEAIANTRRSSIDTRKRNKDGMLVDWKANAYKELVEGRTIKRRKFIKMIAAGIGGAATIANLGDGDVTLGRAKPVSQEILDTSLSEAQRTILQTAWSSPDPIGINGASAIKEVLESMETTGPVELRSLAKKINELMPESGIKLAFKSGNWTAAGAVTVSVPATLTLYGERGLDYGTFMHEVLHANVISRWRSLSIVGGGGQSQRDRLGITPAESAAYKEFENIWKEFKDVSRSTEKDDPAFLAIQQSQKNIDEFFVRALTDGNFQTYLSARKYQGKTLLEKFKYWVSTTIFGQSSGVEPSWLDAGLVASNNLIAVLSKRKPDFAVVQLVREINKTPLASEQEISYSRRRTGTTGQYIGGPKGLDSPQKLASLRKSIKKLAEEGEYGKFWYERSGRQILDLVNGDVNEADKLIQAIAVTSAQTPVAANFDYALQAYYQNKAGKPIFTGKTPVAQSKKLNDIYAGKDWGGRKTNNFYNNLMRVIDPSRSQGVTTDLWMMRAFGYFQDSPTDAQYDFVEQETARLAGQLGWEPQQVQAAIWVALKSKAESKPVKAKTEEKSIRNKWMKLKTRTKPDGKVVRERVILDKEKHAKNWLEQSLKHTPTLQEKEAANFDYADASVRQLGQISYESIPGDNTNHMVEMFEADYPVLQDYHVEMSKAFLDDQGNDIISGELGMLSPMEFEAPGHYEGKVSPGSQTGVTIPKQYKVDLEASPEGKLLMDAYSAVKGILLKQKAMGYHKPFFKKGLSKNQANGMLIDIGRPFTEAETGELGGLLRELSGHGDFNPIGDVNGARLINFSEAPNKEFLDIVNTAMRSIEFDGNPEVVGELFAADTGYLENNWEENKNGEGYLEDGLRGQLDLQRKVRDIVTLLQPRIAAVEEEFSNKYGWTRNPDLNRAYEDTTGELVPPPKLLAPEFPTPREIPSQDIEDAVAATLEEAENAPLGSVPPYSVNAAPESQAVARNPELGAKLSDEQEIFYSKGRPLDKETQSVIDEVITSPTKGKKGIPFVPPEKGNAKEQFSKFRSRFINKYDPIEKLSREMSETMDTLADSSAIAAMFFADRSQNVLAAAIKYGVPVYRDGMTTVKDFIYNGKTVKGLIGVLAPLQVSGNAQNTNLEQVFQAYAIGQRAKEINDSGKMSPVKKGDEQAFLARAELEANKYINPETGVSYVKEVYDMYQAYNNEVITFMKDTGLITDKEAASWSRSSTYYPFYKDFNGDPDAKANTIDSTGKPNNPDSILGVGTPTAPSYLPVNNQSQKLKKLEGSSEKIDVPAIDAIVQNLGAAIEMGMKNIGYQRAMRDAVYLGYAHKVDPKTKYKKSRGQDTFLGNYYVRENGKDVHYKVQDEILFTALLPISDHSAVSMITNVTSIPARFLREAVTRAPGFMFTNMVRDTMSAGVTSGASFVPVIDTAKNFVGNLEQFERMGLVSGYDALNDPKDVSKFLKKEMRKLKMDTSQGLTGKAWEKSFGRVWDLLGEGTNRSDFTTRKSVYDDVLARTGNQSEAAFQAMEVLNFGRRGGNAIYRVISASTPFLNARIQGLDVLWRAANGTYSSRSDLGKAQIQKQALLRGLALTGITALYWLLTSDDDQYKEASDYVRENNWLIPNPFGEQSFKIPIPFEVGLIFKTIPEAILNAFLKDTGASDVAATLERGVYSTLAMNPLGSFQIAAPVVEAYLNKNFFTGRPIVPHYVDESVAKGFQETFTSSQIASWLGKELNFSPRKIDHVMEGYAGTLGIFALDSVDRILRSPEITGDFSRSMPAFELGTNPAFKRFFTKIEGTGYVEDFYEINDVVRRTVTTLNLLDKEGRVEEYNRYLYGRSHLLEMQADMNSISNDLSELRADKMAIMRMDINGDQKLELTRAIDSEINDVLKIMPILRQQARLPAGRESLYKE